MHPIQQSIAQHIHAFYTNTKPIDLSIYQNVLCKEEIEEWQKMHSEKRKNEFLSGRIFLRECLNQHIGVSSTTWSFKRTPYGQPYIEEPSNHRHIRFSISHTLGVAACIISDCYPVGIDIEQYGRVREPLEIAHRFFGEQEIYQLEQQHDPEQQSILFSHLWSLKEAVLKAEGQGIRLSLKSVQFDLSTNAIRPTITHLDSTIGQLQNWRVQRWQPSQDRQYTGALAVNLAVSPNF